MVCAFRGWNDAADAASAALTFVGSALGATRFATIDPEEFFDFQSTRPKIRLTEGRTREITWPAIEIYEARIPRAPRDLILLSGAEPSMRWPTFCRTVLDLAEALGIQLVVTLGALLADVPHTRPVGITGHRLRRRAGREARPRAPRATRARPASPACCTRRATTPACRARACGRPCPTTSPPRPTRRRRSPSCASSRGSSACRSTPRTSRRAAEEYERQVNLAVRSDPDVQAFVERLEEAAGEAEEPANPTDLPSGDVIAREFQRFLRQRGGDA